MREIEVNGIKIDVSPAGAWYDGGELVALLHRMPGFLARLAEFFAGHNPVNETEDAIANEPFPEKSRYDPLSGDILIKTVIENPNSGGEDVCIDFNPRTGGTFLDRGELKRLSKIPDIVAQLETIIGKR